MMTFFSHSYMAPASESESARMSYGQLSKCHVCFCGLDPGNWNLRQYGHVSSIFAFRIWDARFEILRFEIMKTDHLVNTCVLERKLTPHPPRTSQNRSCLLNPRKSWIYRTKRLNPVCLGYGTGISFGVQIQFVWVMALIAPMMARIVS